MSNKIKRGERVTIICSYSPYFGQEGWVVSHNRGKTQVYLGDGFIQEFHRADLARSRNLNPEWTRDSLTNLATRISLRQEIEDKVRERVEEAFPELSGKALDSITSDLTHLAMSRYLKDDDVPSWEG